VKARAGDVDRLIVGRGDRHVLDSRWGRCGRATDVQGSRHEGLLGRVNAVPLWPPLARVHFGEQGLDRISRGLRRRLCRGRLRTGRGCGRAGRCGSTNRRRDGLRGATPSDCEDRACDGKARKHVTWANGHLQPLSLQLWLLPLAPSTACNSTPQRTEIRSRFDYCADSTSHEPTSHAHWARRQSATAQRPFGDEAKRILLPRARGAPPTRL